MKKYLICFLLLSFILSSISIYAEENPTYEDGQKDGETEASKSNEIIWTLIGCGSTCLTTNLLSCTPLGCFGSSALGYFMNPNPPVSASGKGDEYVKGFKDSYGKKIKQKRAINAFVGGTVITVVEAVVVTVIGMVYGTFFFGLLAFLLNNI